MERERESGEWGVGGGGAGGGLEWIVESLSISLGKTFTTSLKCITLSVLTVSLVETTNAGQQCYASLCTHTLGSCRTVDNEYTNMLATIRYFQEKLPF